MANQVVTASAGQGVMVTETTTGRTNLVPGVVLINPSTGLPYSATGGAGGGGSSDTTEATQLLIKTAVQNIDTDLGAAGDAAATSDTGAFSIIAFLKRGLQNWTSVLSSVGAPLATSASWYDTTASLISLLKLSVAAFVGAGSRTYIYTNGVLTSEQWTLFGTTRTKTYTYTSGALTGESDWV